MSVPRLFHNTLEEWLDLGLDAGSEGGTLYTAGAGRSIALTTIGDVQVDRETFRPPQLLGRFVHDHGPLGMPITIAGVLRMTETGRAAILLQRRAWKLTAGSILFLDDDDTEYDSCELLEFRIDARVRIENDGLFSPGSGERIWRMEYRIELNQMELSASE